MNGYFIGEPNSRLKKNIAAYYEEAEAHGWPDRQGRGRFKYGWDAERRRGVVTGRYVHVSDNGIGNLDRAARALELQWDYYGPFGFAALLAEGDEPLYDPSIKVTADLLRQKEVAIHGTKNEVIERILRIKEAVGYEDFMFNAWFELGGFEGGEIEEQMQYFAEEILPVLRREGGGRPERPESEVQLEPAAAAPATG